MSNSPKIDNSVQSKRSNQNLSCNWTGTSDFGRLVPFDVNELIAGDKVVRCRPNIELQMLPIASPTFGKMDLYVHYFFVPHRLTFKNYYDVKSQKGAGRTDEFPYVQAQRLTSYYNATTAARNLMYKHLTSFGLPPFFALPNESLPESIKYDHLTALKLRAYQRIYWDFYRDPELISDDSKDRYIYDTGGEITDPLEELPQLVMPRFRFITNNWIAQLYSSPGFTPANENELWDAAFLGNTHFPDPETVSDNFPVEHDSVGDMFRVSTYPSGNSSRMMRLVETLSRLSERLSLSGKRQIDQFMSRYGVRPNWLKMNMCQYLGGAKSTVLVSDITSSADTTNPLKLSDGGMPLGAKAASGYSRFNELNIEFEAQEDGYMIGIFSVMPHVHFVQGLDKSWYRNSITDFFSEHLQRVGNVAVSKKEISVPRPSHSVNNPAELNNSFAFTEPYYEYKIGRDIIAGDFIKYFDSQSGSGPEDVDTSVQYMQSMALFADFAKDNGFNAESLTLYPNPYNKIFFYQGGSIWQSQDDHFHLSIDKDILINRPMDGFAIPTLETTERPHEGQTALPTSTTL